MEQDIDVVLRASATSLPPSPQIDSATDDLVSATHGAVIQQKSRRRGKSRWFIPAAFVAAAALTGAALPPLLNPDVTIPVHYVTDEGSQVSCRYSLTVGSVLTGHNPELRRWVKDHDWAGIGQHAYDNALSEQNAPDTTGDEQISAEVQAHTAWFSAMSTLILSEVPDDLLGPGSTLGMSSDCMGQLH